MEKQTKKKKIKEVYGVNKWVCLFVWPCEWFQSKFCLYHQDVAPRIPLTSLPNHPQNVSLSHLRVLVPQLRRSPSAPTWLAGASDVRRISSTSPAPIGLLDSSHTSPCVLSTPCCTPIVAFGARTKAVSTNARSQQKWSWRRTVVAWIRIAKHIPGKKSI